MAEYGILVDYNWCTGCHSCEIACQTEHDLPVGQTGIQVFEVGPWQIDRDTWQYSYMPVPTDQCDLCGQRIAAGKEPTCIKHCQARCMAFGKLEQLAEKIGSHTKQCLYALG